MAFKGMALRVGRTPQNSEIRAYKDGAKSEFWDPYLLVHPVVKEVKTGNPENGKAAVDLKLQFTRAGTSGGKPAADQGFIADVHLILSGQGYVDISYELTPVNAQDYLLELGLALKLSAPSTRLTWLGEGPYPTYPGQTDSMERGVYTIAPKADFDPANRVYPGNRTEVALAAATDNDGSGVGILCDDGTVSLEPTDGAVILSHLVRVAGHGEKRSISSVNIKAADLRPVSGAIRIVPLITGQWPEVFKSVLGKPQPAP